MLYTNVGSVRLENPLLLASGYITETADFFLEAQGYGCAGLVTRSFKFKPPPERERTPAPRYAFHPHGDNIAMLNCEWGSSVPWQRWIQTEISKVRKTNSAIIVSISGREVESATQLIEAFDGQDIDAYEINISCSHSGAIHGNLNVDISHLGELLRAVRPLTKRPVWIKLSYSTLLLDMAKEAEANGADAIVCTNSIGPGMLIDTRTGLPKLGIKGGAGGITGRAIFPIALNCVYLLKQAVKIPIIGVGGIYSADDVIQMLMAGASAVQLYTAPALEGPSVFSRITDGLEDFFTRQRCCVSDIVGIAQGKRDGHNFVATTPVIHADGCVGCGACKNACVFKAITLRDGLAYINADRCESCNACASACKRGAIETRF